VIVAILVGLAAGVGAVARYVTDQVVQHQHESDFPYGTFLINATGSLLLGLISGLAMHHGLRSGPAVVLSAGFCGGFTTWSTFAYETAALARTGALREAVANVAGSITVGLLAAAAGFGIALL